MESRFIRKQAQFSDTIRFLARKTTDDASISRAARKIARSRISCPVDYMRYAEFDAVLRELTLDSPMTLLDIGSPQWFSLYLASRYSGVDFQYINIVPSELNPYREIASALGLDNLDHRIADVRSLEIPDNIYNRVISISAIEHIFPVDDGDEKGVKEIARVLKPGGEFFMSVPFKEKRNIVYVDGPVYERNELGQNFFAREYDEASFSQLVKRSGLVLSAKWFVCERRGFFAVDYYEWGPGKNTFIAKINSIVRKLTRRIPGVSFDELLAKRYLVVSDQITDRVVNIVARLRKP